MRLNLRARRFVFMTLPRIFFVRVLCTLALRRAIRQQRARNAPLRVIMGAGSTRYRGWIATDYPVVDALRAHDWHAFFPPASISHILAEHVVEHWSEPEMRHFLRTVRPFLARGARIRLAVPDGNHPDPAYIRAVRPDRGDGGDPNHQVLYTFPALAQLAAEEGYACTGLEYFDAQGEFHHTPWDASDGFVARSAAHDPRNRVCPLSFTSVIVDLLPYDDDEPAEETP